MHGWLHGSWPVAWLLCTCTWVIVHLSGELERQAAPQASNTSNTQPNRITAGPLPSRPIASPLPASQTCVQPSRPPPVWETLRMCESALLLGLHYMTGVQPKMRQEMNRLRHIWLLNPEWPCTPPELQTSPHGMCGVVNVQYDTAQETQTYFSVLDLTVRFADWSSRGLVFPICCSLADIDLLASKSNQ